MKDKRIILLLFGLIVCVSLVSGVHASFASVKYCGIGIVATKSSNLNVRSKPSTSGEKLASLSKGTEVRLIEKSGDWWNIEYAKGKTGYCSASYIKVKEGTCGGYVNTKSSGLNVRKGPGTSYDILSSLKKGDYFLVLSESEGWCRIEFGEGKEGYVSSKYVGKFYGDSRTDVSPSPVKTQNPDKTATPSPAATPEKTASVPTAKPTERPTEKPVERVPAKTYPKIRIEAPLYKQTDRRWKTYKLGTTGNSIATVGCLVSSLAMAESYRTGREILPDAQADTMEFTAGGSAYWPENYRIFFAGSKTDYMEKVYSILETGRPVLMGCKKDNGGQHWVLITGYNGPGNGPLKGEYFTINDPASAGRTTLAMQWEDYPHVYYISYYSDGLSEE